MNTESWPEVAEVVGENARRLRGAHKVEEVARKARAAGLKWNSGRVSDLERGRISPTLPTLFVLAEVLGDLTGKPVSFVDLVQAEGFVRINGRLTVSATSLASAASGDPVVLRAGDVDGAVGELASVLTGAQEELRSLAKGRGVSIGQIRNTYRAHGDTETRVARDLSITEIRLAQESAHLWEGRTFSQERDARAGEDANAQKRGRISRELKAKLKEALSDGA